MTRREMLENLEEIKDEIAWDSGDELTDHAREKAYICIEQAIEYINENEEQEEE